MFARGLLLATLALVCAPASAELITISEGHYPRINLTPERELLMTGGTIDYLNNLGGLATIKDGRINSSRVTLQGTVIVEGVDGWGNINAERVPLGEGATVEVHGYNFRVESSHPWHEYSSSHRIEGWFLDGQYGSLNIGRKGDPRVYTFRVVTHEPTFSDVDGDWDFDVHDLNAVRNNFGGEGFGDTDFDGDVDLFDLNNARNKFGGGNFNLAPEMEFDGLILLGDDAVRPVPEPASLGLMALGVIALPCILGRCRLWSSLRPSP